MTPEQNKQFDEMYNWFLNMQKSSTIPRETHQAIKERFIKPLLDVGLFNSSVSPATKQQVHEGVAFPQIFSGFKEDKDGNLFPYYTP
jgi:hypothetical protein